MFLQQLKKLLSQSFLWEEAINKLFQNFPIIFVLIVRVLI